MSTEQLERERGAASRLDEVKRKAEAETRAKEAEAQAKEIEAHAKQHELFRKRRQEEDEARELAARGPLTEATIRLYYADAEEVAKTLQGLLGMTPDEAPRKREAVSGPPVIPEPPFSSLFGPPPAASAPGPGAPGSPG